MQRKKIAVYSSIIPDDIMDYIDDIKISLLKQNILIEDFIIITRDLLGYRPKHSAVFYDFYLTFYDCDVVFLYVKDMIEKYESIKDKKIYLYGKHENTPSDIEFVTI